MTVFCAERLAIFSENCQRFRAAFFEDGSIFPRMGAFLCAAMGQEASDRCIADAKQTALQADRLFDGVSTELLPLLTAYFALPGDAENRLVAATEAYQLLKTHFLPSPYLALTACAVAYLTDGTASIPEIAVRMNVLYGKMTEHHPILTGYDDLSACALYVLSDKDDDGAVHDMEACAEQLKKDGFFRNSTQALTHVLAFYRHPLPACARAVALSRALKAARVGVGTGYAQAAIGALVPACGDDAEAALRVVEADRMIRRIPGFSPFSVSAKERRMYAILLNALETLKAENGTIPSHRMAFRAAFLSCVNANTSGSATY